MQGAPVVPCRLDLETRDWGRLDQALHGGAMSKSIDKKCRWLRSFLHMQLPWGRSFRPCQRALLYQTQRTVEDLTIRQSTSRHGSAFLHA